MGWGVALCQALNIDVPAMSLGPANDTMNILGVQENGRVRTGQVESLATRPCAEQEHKGSCRGSVRSVLVAAGETINGKEPLLTSDTAIQPFVAGKVGAMHVGVEFVCDSVLSSTGVFARGVASGLVGRSIGG